MSKCHYFIVVTLHCPLPPSGTPAQMLEGWGSPLCTSSQSGSATTKMSTSCCVCITFPPVCVEEFVSNYEILHEADKIYIWVSPSSDSGVRATLGVLVLVGQFNSLYVVVKGEWSCYLPGKSFLLSGVFFTNYCL
jgi:hypothetical protein